MLSLTARACGLRFVDAPIYPRIPPDSSSKSRLANRPERVLRIRPEGVDPVERLKTGVSNYKKSKFYYFSCDSETLLSRVRI